MDEAEREDICNRYSRLYSGIVADTLDGHGYRHQILPYYITPLTTTGKVAGFAFTGEGYPTAEPSDNDSGLRVAMLDSITPLSVSVWACGGHTESAHWGEIMSAAARERGAVGAVIDGGVRDLDLINQMRFPVFARFKCAASSIGRWNIKAWQTPITIGQTRIEPGDFVFGDTDGVVVVPKAVIVDVLAAAEKAGTRERGMRKELQAGGTVKDAYRKYGTF